MKPLQIKQINDLGRCWLTKSEMLALAELQTWLRWDERDNVSTFLNSRWARYLRRLWNKYRPQIRAIERNRKGE